MTHEGSLLLDHTTRLFLLLS